MNDLNLKEMRLQAQFSEGVPLTQAELAKRIGVSQVQVSRYEEDPDSIPLSLYWKWRRACGLDDASTAGLDAGSPYDTFVRDLNLLKEHFPGDLDKGLPPEAPSPSDFRNRVSALQRKPHVVIAGPFDAGKSRMANALLGQDFLPHGYQPLTRVVTFIRHKDERPTWMQESVWIMNAGFAPDQWANEEHCSKHRMVAGELDTLKKYGAHKYGAEEGTELKEAFSALVFVDAPILKSCTLIDLPGDMTNEDDTRKAVSVSGMTDVLIFASPATQFMTGSDSSLLGEFLRRLPAPEISIPELPSLGNVLLVATRADQNIDDENMERIKTIGTTRLFRHFEATLWKERSDRTKKTIDAKVLRERVVTFWAEIPERRRELETRLVEMLSTFQPRIRRKLVEQEVVQFRDAAGKYFEPRIREYEKLLSAMKDAEEGYKKLEREEPTRKEKVGKRRKAVFEAIAQHRETNLGSFSGFNSQLIDPEYLRQVIQSRYPDKDEAQSYAARYFLEVLRDRYEQELRERSEKIKPLLDEVVGEYQKVATQIVGLENSKLQIPFDANGAFLGGLAGAGALGALGIWASSLGNLGGYIIAAKAIGVLSSLGITVSGGAAAVMSAIAAIGGPVTIALGLCVTLAGVVWKLFGESWQTRLAKQVHQVFIKERVSDYFARAIGKYWEDTQAAFVEASNAIETRWEEELLKLRDLAEKPRETKATIEMLVEKYRQILVHASNLP